MQAKANANSPQKFFIGTSGWVYPAWRGVFYPQDLAQNKWFAYYASKFASVEINATYYRNFTAQTYAKWYQNAPHNFQYVLKAHRIIVHRKKITQAEIMDFWQAAKLLQDKLGLILLQFPANFPYDLEHLQRLLALFPDPSKIAVEFRHAKWFTQDTQKLLKKLKVTFCNVDSPDTELTDWLTSGIGYLRLHGKDAWYHGCYTKRELAKVAELARNMVKKGAKKVYIFFNNDFKGYAPQNALQLVELLHD